MLPSKDRLRFREVEEVFKKGQRKATPFFSATFLSGADRTAFGVSVSKKVMKNASDRNKIRRRIYSVLSKFKKYKSNTHVVFTPKKDVLGMPFETLKKEIEDFLARAKIL